MVEGSAGLADAEDMQHAVCLNNTDEVIEFLREQHIQWLK
jgi:hypothetical protein